MLVASLGMQSLPAVMGSIHTLHISVALFIHLLTMEISGRYVTVVLVSIGKLFLPTVMENTYIYSSSSYGQSWSLVYSVSSSLNWWSISTCSSGQYTFAVAYPGSVYSSSDYGQSWSVSYDTSQNWRGVATSGTGQYCYGAVYGGNLYSQTIVLFLSLCRHSHRRTSPL